MSSVSLPSYRAPLPPSYAAGRPDHPHRLPLVDRPQFLGTFVKNSGNIFLRLSAQEDEVSLPVYGSSALVEGTVELTNIEGVPVSSVEVKVEGKLHIYETAEDGTSSVKICSKTALLWNKDLGNGYCPSSLRFSIQLPTTFTHAEKTYPLPPTFNVKLKGIPGFNAKVGYSVSAVISKDNGLPHLNSKALGLHVGSDMVSTPFIYYPRSRPSRSIASPLKSSKDGLEITPEWHVMESILRSRKVVRPDIKTKFYTPALGVFCITQPIPFYLTLESSAVSLAAFLPFSPTTSTSAPRKVMRVQLMRQTNADVRDKVIDGVKTDIWRVDQIGEGTFTLVANSNNRISYSGEISIDPAVNIPGFRGAGLSVNDFIVFTLSPLEPAKSPFQDLRQVIPVYLATDPFEDNDEGGIPQGRTSFSSTYMYKLDPYRDEEV